MYIIDRFFSAQMAAMPKTYLRPISSAVVAQSQTLAAQNTTPVAFLPQVRSFQTSPVTRDIDSAAKFIGAGAATVGVAGSGKCIRPKLGHADGPHNVGGVFCCWVQFHCRRSEYGLVEILHLGHTNGYLVTHSACLGKV